MGANLNLSVHKPDLSAGYLTTSYSATTGIISVNGWPLAFNLNGNSTPDYPSIVGGQYRLSAQVTPTGKLMTGSLKITGTIPSLATSGTLLTGQLSQFEYQSAGGDIFGFIFDVTGGDLAPYYNGEAGVILDATNSGFKGSFSNNFAASPFLSVADNTAIHVVPEPSTMLLLLSVLAFGLPAWACHRLRHLGTVK